MLTTNLAYTRSLNVVAFRVYETKVSVTSRDFFNLQLTRRGDLLELRQLRAAHSSDPMTSRPVDHQQQTALCYRPYQAI